MRDPRGGRSKKRKEPVEDEFLQLVIEMRKAQIACKFGRKPSAYEKRSVAEHKVDEYINKMKREP